ncbi:MAG: hypothetical protein Q9187_005689 [Circinaria calcarea]
MRFSRNLPFHQIPEWAPAYLKYDKLARIASSTATTNSDGKFYNRIHAVVSLKLNALKDCYGIHQDDCSAGDWTEIGDSYELDDILATAHELRTLLKKLQWFGKVNHDGFSIVLKKAKKAQSLLYDQGLEMESRLRVSEFTSQQKCLETLEYVDTLMNDVNRVRFQDHLPTEKDSLLVNTHYKRYSSFTSSSFITTKSIREDDSSTLDTIIRHHELIDGQPLVHHQYLLLRFLRYGILCGSRHCINLLLSHIDSLHGPALIDGQTCLHYLAIKLRRKTSDWPAQNTSSSSSRTTISLLKYIVEHLSVQQSCSILEPDVFGRLPLHYAAESGDLEATQLLLQFMATRTSVLVWKAALAEDIEGQTVLSPAVIGGHVHVIKALLQFYSGNVSRDEHNGNRKAKIPGSTLLAAIRSGFVDGVALLLKSNTDLEFQDESGQTLLHMAVRFGQEDCVKLLLNASSKHNTILNTPELGGGWTPLTMAARSGNLLIVRLLVDAGANQEIRDNRGWTAKEYAAYRGFLKVAELLEVNCPGELLLSPNSNHSARKQSYTNNPDISFSTTPSSSFEDHDKPFYVFINLGSLSTKKSVIAIDLSGLITQDSPPESNLYIKLRTADGSQASGMASLPLLEDRSNEPWLFWTKDVGTLKLVFDIFSKTNYCYKRYQLLGSGIAILPNLRPNLGVKRESLVRDYTIPILETATLKSIGNITFSILVVAPSRCGGSSSVTEHRQWMDQSPIIIGHRGSGQNDSSRERLQIGENTIESFQSAVNLGASYVEFLSIYKAQASGSDLLSTTEAKYFKDPQNGMLSRGRSRSRSLNEYGDNRTTELMERMKNTFDFKLKGFKANTRGNYIHNPLVTLKEVLQNLPESIGLNVELKYPMLFEADDWELDPYAVEVNVFVDEILHVLYMYGGGRSVILSSFSPEICILLSVKRQKYSVLFVTDGGKFPVGDNRVSSLQEAVHFAKAWSLAGVAVMADPLVLCPRLIQYVKSFGLMCVSHGSWNDDPANAKVRLRCALLVVDKLGLPGL